MGDTGDSEELRTPITQEAAGLGDLDPSIVDAILNVFPEGSYFTFRACLNEERAKDVAAIVRVIAWQLSDQHPHIAYSGLKRIIFAGDYLEALADLGKEFNRTFSTTTEPIGAGVAITNNVPGGCIVVLAGGLAEQLLSGDEASRGRAAAVIAHELCHVSDETYKANVLIDVWLKPAHGLDRVFLPGALAMWSEYFANRHTATFVQDPTETTGLLRDALATVEEDVRSALTQYRSDFDLDGILQLISTKLRFLAQCIGYTAGLVHGIGKGIRDLDVSCAEAITQSRIGPHWDPLLKELVLLNDNYATWDSRALNPLKRRMEALIRAYGFNYRLQADGSLYVDVPKQPWETY